MIEEDKVIPAVVIPEEVLSLPEEQSKESIMEQNEPAKSSAEQIADYTERAVVVYRFLLSLPDAAGRTIFKAIVDDAYETAELMDAKDACNLLSISMLEHFYSGYYGDTSQADVMLDGEGGSFSDAVDQFQGSVNSGDPIGCIHAQDSIVTRLYTGCGGALPDRTQLVRCFPMFTVDPADMTQEDSFFPSLVDRLTGQLQRMHGDYGRLEQFHHIDRNVFYALGYQTMLMEWVFLEQDATEPLSDCDVEALSLVYRWFCRGEVLDYALEAYDRAKSSPMRHWLWSLFVDACKGSLALTEVFQERYNMFFGDKAKHIFVCEEKGICRIPALAPLYLDLDKREPAKPEHYHNLWVEFGPKSSKKCFLCSEPEFNALFGGTDSWVMKPVTWYATSKELADFLACCYGITTDLNRSEAEEKYVPLFRSKKGKLISKNTFHSTHASKDPKMVDIVNAFRRSGFKR